MKNQKLRQKKVIYLSQFFEKYCIRLLSISYEALFNDTSFLKYHWEIISLNFGAFLLFYQILDAQPNL